jgi:hypothetical protein
LPGGVHDDYDNLLNTYEKKLYRVYIFSKYML